MAKNSCKAWTNFRGNFRPKAFFLWVVVVGASVDGASVAGVVFSGAVVSAGALG